MLTRPQKSETGSTGLPDCGDSIDPVTFEQILEMDDDEDEREFSKSIVYGFFEQAEATFEKMVTSLYVDTSFVSAAYSHVHQGGPLLPDCHASCTAIHQKYHRSH